MRVWRAWSIAPGTARDHSPERRRQPHRLAPVRTARPSPLTALSVARTARLIGHGFDYGKSGSGGAFPARSLTPRLPFTIHEKG